MKNMDINEIAAAVQGKIIKEGNLEKCSKVSTDTRKISKGDLFIALKGENFNGNKFAREAINKGAYIAIVSEVLIDLDGISKSSGIILVDDTLAALTRLSSYVLSKSKVLTIGITGSTGKTSTKDLTAAALSYKFKVYKTKGNFNNEIGLPLSILEMPEDTEVAVLEMGMSNLKEINHLAGIAKPSIGIITNIGISHIENLKTRDNILKAKMEITDYFTKENTLIINRDNDMLKSINSDKFNVCGIGIDYGDCYAAKNIELLEDLIKYTCISNKTGEEYDFTLECPGKHNVLNSLLAIACARKLGLSFEEINEGFKNISRTSLRLEIIKNHNYTVVNDCYNASPDSMISAIDVLKNIKGKRYIAVLGTMNELGEEAPNAHYEVGKYLKEKIIDKLYVLGDYSNKYAEGFGGQYEKAQDIEDLISLLLKDVKEGDVILVKASRTYKFERITEALTSKRS